MIPPIRTLVVSLALVGCKPKPAASETPEPLPPASVDERETEPEEIEDEPDVEAPPAAAEPGPSGDVIQGDFPVPPAPQPRLKDQN